MDEGALEMRPKKRKMAHGEDGVIKFTQLLNENSLVLDIGSGDKRHADYMQNSNIRVKTNDLHGDVDYLGNYNEIDIDEIFDGIHCAHVLEHQPNPHNFLKKIHSNLREGGWLCITVPPLKHQIVGGHVSLWNAGIILYHLVLAGFNCKDAKIKEYGYNISVIIKKDTIEEMPNLVYDGPDLLALNPYFPRMNFGKYGEFFGDIKSLNW